MKLSRFTCSAATGLPLRRARLSICSVRSRISARFGRPVSWSWLARKASCSPRLSSSASWRIRSFSKTSHIRTSVTSSVACAIASARRRARSVTPCSAAASRSTSPTLSRQRRQRLVTSCSGASRCAASCPNSSKASRAASLPSSGRPPDIQSATVTVAIVQIRSRLSSTCGDSSPCASAVRSTHQLEHARRPRAQRRAEDANLLGELLSLVVSGSGHGSHTPRAPLS